MNPDLDYVQNNLDIPIFSREILILPLKRFRMPYPEQQNKRYHNNLGLAYARNGQFDLAFQEFKLADGEAKAHYNIAQFYYQNGLYEEAKIHFAKASSIKSCR